MTGIKASFACLILFFCLLAGLTAPAMAAGKPLPNEGGYVMEGTTQANVGTDFYIYIEKSGTIDPPRPSEPGENEPGETPKPSQPGTPEPSQPGTPEPSQPGTPEPSQPGTPEPSQPGGGDPQDQEPQPTVPPETPGTGLPKTGDSGLDAGELMLLSLLFGFLYLLCHFYAKKKHG